MRRLRAAAGPVAVIVAVIAVLTAACASEPVVRATPPTPTWAPASSWAPAPDSREGLAVLARAAAGRFVLPTTGGERDFLAGVNLGAATPGHAPGELSVDRARYRRWFGQMGDMGVRVVRIYTIHPPAFYEEMLAYNRVHPDAPLYLIQGVYLPDESYVETGNLYDPGPAAAFADEIVDAVGAVHGDLRRDPTPGRAAGSWTADISPWIAAYIIGVEWDPPATHHSDALNATAPAFAGTYFSSAPDATPTERWLASMLDLTARSEAAQGRSVPLAFANWPSTDPLDHPLEPLEAEDLVAVDANRIVASPAWPAGQFASYHAYPYYPDFQRYEYDRFEHGGKIDNYAGYLSALRDHHARAGVPTVISELGVPSSLGSAHLGPLGRDQGDHSEAEAMAIDAELVGLVHDLGLGGAILFEWTDEWFKFTWNTVDFHIPADRRPVWHDAWTNEQHFGVVAADAGHAQAVVVDGRVDEWAGNASRREVQADAGTIREVSTYHDEAYVYLGVRFDRPAPWRDTTVNIGFDVVPGGAGSLPGQPGVGGRSDVVVSIDRNGAASLLAWPGADAFTQLYGRSLGYFGVDPASVAEGSGAWVPRRLLTNRALRHTRTGASQAMETFDLSAMREGTTDPAAVGFDSRNLWATQGDELEMRIPWAALGFSDPSSAQVLAFDASGAISGSMTTPGVGLTVAAGTEVATATLAAPTWQTATWHERPKAGSGQLTEMLRLLAGG